MQEILDAILNDASGPELQGLPLPETFRAATVHKDDVELFAGLLSEEKDPKKSIHIDQVPIPELAPDEARVLRFLATAGAQPAVDVRAGKTPLTGSQMVAPGLSMIGAESGIRWMERLPAYLNNLFRLGLIWFSREPIENPLVYQVLEAQPDVLEAMRRAGRGKTIRRSIHLTPFGEDFCRVCLPLRGTVEEPKP